MILQPSFLGFDNEYLFQARCSAAPGRFRGVPWISPSVETVTADDWESLAQIGVQWPALPDLRPADAAVVGLLQATCWPRRRSATGRSTSMSRAQRLPELLPLLLDGGNKVVIPHYGMFDRTLGPVRDPGFKVLLEKARTGRNLWVVMCGAYRVGPGARPLGHVDAA